MSVAELVDDSELRRTVTAVEAAQSFLAQIEVEQPRLRALTSVTAALEDPRRAVLGAAFDAADPRSGGGRAGPTIR